MGCGRCHVPQLDNGDITLPAFTDLLLHDMGPGLADQLAEAGADGAEWRTAPLWGLDRTSGDYLHDGRARTLEEAIAWHDGEARQARQAFQGLDRGQRDDVIAFLDGL